MAEKIEVGITIKGTQKASDSMNALDQGIKKAGSGMDGLVGLTDKFTGGAATGMINAYKGTLTFIKGLKLTKVALISTGIGAIVVLVGALVAAFMSSEEQAKGLKVMMAGLGAVVDRVTGYFKAAGGFIVGLFTGGTQKALENYNKEMDKLPGSMQDAIDKAMELERRLQALAQAQRESGAIQARASLQAKKVLKEAEDITKTTEQRIALIEKANAIEKKAFDKRMSMAEEERSILVDQVNGGDRRTETMDKLLAATAATLKLEEERMDLTDTGANRIKKLRDEEAALKEETKQAKQDSIDQKKEDDATAKATQDAIDAAKLAAQIKLEDDLYALSLSSFERQELALQEEFDKRSAIAEGNDELLKEAEQRLIDDLAALQKKADDDKAAAQKVLDDRQAASDAKKIAQELAVSASIKTARMSVVSSSFDALNAMAKTEEQSKKLAIAQILVNQAIAMSQAIAGATTSATATGPGAFVATPLFIAQALGIVIGSFASIKGVMNQAGAATDGLDLSPPSVGGGGGGGGGGGESSGMGNQLALTPDMAGSFLGNSAIPPVQAYIVQNDIADAGALQTELQTQASL
jgi:hypothetical protein